MTAPRPPVTLRAIDSHTGGEPTRLIVDGFPDLGGGNMGGAGGTSGLSIPR